MGALSEARRQVESYCQSLVDAGTAEWWVNHDGDIELHMNSGEAYLFGELGATRLKRMGEVPHIDSTRNASWKCF